MVDLAFVVAVAQAASGLEDGLRTGRVAHAIAGYLAVFFALWWAWMNYTWFGSAFDNDDGLYRLALFVQVLGVVILAAGVAPAFDGNFATVTIGYVVMRVAMVFQWWRVSLDPRGRPAGPRYAIGILVLQIGWVVLLSISPPAKWVGFALLVLAEFAVPLVVERDNPTSWHAGHIVERFGLLTIIVIGESITSAMLAMKAAVDTRQQVGSFVTIAIGAVLTVASLWWLYFGIDHERSLSTAHTSAGAQRRQAFVWAYGHYVVFASVAAIGAGISVATKAVAEGLGGGAHPVGHGVDHPGLAYTIPVAAYLVSVWLLHRKSGADKGWKTYLVPAAAAVVVPIGLADHAVLIGGVVLTVLIGLLVAPSRSSADSAAPADPLQPLR